MTKFFENDEIMTPLGLGVFLEECNGHAYVELDNGVEMDFPIDLIETKEDGLARIQRETEVKFAKHYQAPKELEGPSFVQRLALADALFNTLSAEAQAGIRRLAHQNLMERCEQIVKENDG